ncbi:DC-STAMP domain-containing protein 1-like [Elysia marginata]|uniref:DC-STAMP domain-containing protein 1-like n=1 Tax=Elysia marginata TaxID=1093978 RepID=A0AAV4FL32_9GAST|nr:DC-STAMP domain-containing protein 1-like [Elysia marginata]
MSLARSKQDTFRFGTGPILTCTGKNFSRNPLMARHVIAGFFYRKQEKKRVLHLYNEMFRRRIGYLGHLRKIIRKSLRKREYKKKTSLLVTLQRRHPKYFRWLRLFKSAKEDCVICGDPQDPGFYLCQTPGCGIAYCKQCWKDVKKKCYACSRGEKDDDDDNDDDEADFVTDSSDVSGSE